MKNKIILAGGTGFLGRMLQLHFVGKGAEVVVLSRNAVGLDASGRLVQWDGETRGDWCRELEDCKAVINLAGRSVDCRYHALNRRLIMDSRVNSTRVLGEAIRACADPPEVWLNSSTATIYKHSYDVAMDETDGLIGSTPEAKDEFSIEVARAWEEEFDASETMGTRKVAMRSAMVLGSESGSVFMVLRRLARLGLGGRMGDGRQYVSWIHQDDFCRVVECLIERKDISGVVNVAAPNPLPNAEMMRLFREAVGMPIGLPATDWMLEIGAFVLRTETELIIKSRRVVPRRLAELGFRFQYENMADAVRDLERRVRGGEGAG